MVAGGLVLVFRRRASDASPDSEIYTMNADGTNAVNRTNHPASDVDPNWAKR